MPSDISTCPPEPPHEPPKRPSHASSTLLSSGERMTPCTPSYDVEYGGAEKAESLEGSQ